MSSFLCHSYKTARGIIFASKRPEEVAQIQQNLKKVLIRTLICSKLYYSRLVWSPFCPTFPCGHILNQLQYGIGIESCHFFRFVAEYLLHAGAYWRMPGMHRDYLTIAFSKKKNVQPIFCMYFWRPGEYILYSSWFSPPP